MHSASVQPYSRVSGFSSSSHALGEMRVVDFLYLAYLFGVVCMSTLGYSAGDFVYFALVVIGAVFVGLRLFSLRFDGRVLAMALGLVGVSVVAYIVSRRFTLLLTTMLIISGKDIDIRKVIGTFFSAKLVGLLLMGVFVALGVFEVEHFQYWKSAVGGFIERIRINGSGTNVLHLSYITCMVLWFYLRRGKVSFFFYLMAAFLNLVVYYFLTKSLMGFLVGSGCLCLFLLVQHVNSFRHVFVSLSRWLIPLLVIFSFVTALLYGRSDFVDQLNSLFQGRIRYNSYFLNSYPFSLFGRGMLTDEGNFDNSFVFVWVAYGFVVFLVLYGLMQITIKRLAERDEWVSLAVISVFLVAGLSESFYPAAAVNPSLFFFLPLLDLRTYGQSEKKVRGLR